MKVPFSPPRIDQQIIDEVNDTLRSGWITTGPKTKLFEKKISEYCGHSSTLCVSSASAGLELILRWFGIGEGDEVIIPAYTYAATANAVEHCGARPVFVDVNEDFNFSLNEVEKAISDRTKAIIPVDIAGYPCDYDQLNALVKRNDINKLFKPSSPEQNKLARILILSDAAHSIGAIYKGRKTGTLTDITVFSFHAVKNLTTAEGGAVCLNLPDPFNNKELYSQLNIKSLHGQSKDALAKSQGGNWQYDIVEAGYKYNMTDIQASMGLVEIDRYEVDMLKKRKYIFEKYSQNLEQYPWAQLPEYQNDHKISSCHAYLLRIKGISEEERNKIIKLIFENDVAVNVHFIPLPMMTFYRSKGYDIRKFPVSYDNYSREISLPVYYDLKDDQIEFVVKTIINSVEKLFTLKKSLI